MNDLQVFRFNGNDTTTITIGNEPWFVAKDVCQNLGIKNHKDAVSKLDKDEVG